MLLLPLEVIFLVSLEDIHLSLLKWFNFSLLCAILIILIGSMTLLSHQIVDVTVIPMAAVSSFMHLSSYSVYHFPFIYDPDFFK